jgi:hypothetical protein
MKTRKEIFNFLNDFWAETELGPCAQRALGLPQPGHSAEQVEAARPTTGLAGRRTRPASARNTSFGLGSSSGLWLSYGACV